MNRLAVGILVTLFLLSSITRATQNPATDSNRGSLEGSVLDSVTGQPIEGAQVAIVTGQALTEAGVQSLLADQKPTLQVPQITKVIPAFVLSGRTLMPDRSAHSVLTDARGKFILTSLAPGAYSVAVRADGYNFQVYGEKPYSLAALPVDIREGKVNIGVIRMNPEPRVSGAIIDLAGRPIATIPVYLLRTQPWFDVDGKRQFRVAGETMTDAAGRYVLEKILRQTRLPTSLRTRPRFSSHMAMAIDSSLITKVFCWKQLSGRPELPSGFTRSKEEATGSATRRPTIYARSFSRDT